MPMTYTEVHHRQAVNILGLKSKYKTSNRITAFFVCPNHSDRSPSLRINFRTGSYHCFQCHIHGHISQLVYEKTHRSLQSLLGLSDDLDKLNPYVPVVYPSNEEMKRDTLLDIRGVIVQYSESKEALQYLKDRYILTSVADEMEMQYAEDVRINGTVFVKRLLIPVYDDTGKLINVEGRDVTRKDYLKCLYPKNALKPIYQYYMLDKKSPLFLFEGLIKMAVARGDSYFKNSTSMLGGGFSEYQLKQLKEFQDVVLVPDNDEAGTELITKLREHIKVRVLRITNSYIKDADEIPGKSGMSVEQFRINGGFIFEESLGG